LENAANFISAASESAELELLAERFAVIISQFSTEDFVVDIRNKVLEINWEAKL
jgi:hypothetical protein